ncbi:unnamed protein product, partial [Ectocarpus sp. 12 AP-2014]
SSRSRSSILGSLREKATNTNTNSTTFRWPSTRTAATRHSQPCYHSVRTRTPIQDFSLHRGWGGDIDGGWGGSPTIFDSLTKRVPEVEVVFIVVTPERTPTTRPHA